MVVILLCALLVFGMIAFIGFCFRPPAKWVEAITLGFAICILYLHAVNLFFAISLPSVLPLVCCSLIGARTFFHDGNLRRIRFFLSEHPFSLSAIAILGLWVLYSASFPVTWYDSLLYHIPALNLARYSHLILGIGLLDSRLGMSSSTFLLGALSRSLFPVHFVYHLPNVVYHLFLLSMLANGLFSKKESEHSLPIFATILFFILNGTSLVASLSQEIGLFVWMLGTLTFLRERNMSLALLGATLALTTKSSGVLFFAPIVLLALVLLSVKKAQYTFFPVFLSAALFVTVIATNTIASGYLVFPIASTHFPILANSDVPKEQTIALSQLIYQWARYTPGKPIIENEFVWFTQQFLPTIAPSILLFIVLGSVCLVLKRTASLHALLFLFFACLSAVSYFFAPDMRLLWPFVVLCAASGGSQVIEVIALTRLSPAKITLTASSVLLFMAILATYPRTPPLRKSQVIIPVSTRFNQSTPSVSSAFPFAYTTSPKGDDRCGVASAPCIVDTTIGNKLIFDVDARTKLTRIRRRSND